MGTTQSTGGTLHALVFALLGTTRVPSDSLDRWLDTRASEQPCYVHGERARPGSSVQPLSAHIFGLNEAMRAALKHLTHGLVFSLSPK